MVGDRSQRFPQEGYSRREARTVTNGLWSLARELGYEAQFPLFSSGFIIDDHVPFARRGIPAVDIIDLDYPHWHTTGDTLEEVSAESLQRVGRLVQEYLLRTQILEGPSPPPRPTRQKPHQYRRLKRNNPASPMPQ